MISKKCKHDFYKLSRFIFYVKGIKIIIQGEENPCYHLVSINEKPDQSKYYIDLLNKTLKEVKINGTVLIENLLITYREVSNKIIKDLSEESKKIQDHLIDNFSVELEKNFTRLANCLKKIQELDISNYGNFLQVEAERRAIFLEICDIRINIVASMPLTRRHRKKDKLLLGEAFSSSGDSSGDTKKSPSPNHSFTGEDDKEYYSKLR